MAPRRSLRDTWTLQLLEDQGVDAADKLVLMRVALAAGTPTGTGITVDADAIAAAMGCSRSTLWRRLKPHIGEPGDTTGRWWLVQTQRPTRGTHGRPGRRARYALTTPECRGSCLTDTLNGETRFDGPGAPIVSQPDARPCDTIEPDRVSAASVVVTHDVTEVAGVESHEDAGPCDTVPDRVSDPSVTVTHENRNHVSNGPESCLTTERERDQGLRSSLGKDQTTVRVPSAGAPAREDDPELQEAISLVGTELGLLPDDAARAVARILAEATPPIRTLVGLVRSAVRRDPARYTPTHTPPRTAAARLVPATPAPCVVCFGDRFQAEVLNAEPRCEPCATAGRPVPPVLDTATARAVARSAAAASRAAARAS